MALGYQLIGNGPAKVLVLHGWFGDETMLDPMRPAPGSRVAGSPPQDPLATMGRMLQAIAGGDISRP